MLNALALIASYLLGSIPVGVIVARSQGIDIMSVGSGNIGATNVVRSLGKRSGAVVLVLDVLKGLLPTLIAGWLLESGDWAVYAGVAASFGHMFSPFLKFKGGKGIATTLGVLIAGAPMVAAVCLASFIAVVAITGFVSVGAIAAAVELVLMSIFLGSHASVVAAFSLLVAVILIKHTPNIKRLLEGTEPKFSLKKRAGSEKPEGHA